MSWLDAALRERRTFRFGEIEIRPSAGEEWTVSGPGDGELIVAACELGEFLRYDDAGKYRPLSGAKNMRTGWTATTRNDAALRMALEAAYPLAVRHIEMYARRELRRVPLDEVLRRQSGRYESSAGLSGRGRELAKDVVCGQCVRTPVWSNESVGPGDEMIPCPEPCSIFVSFCREAATWERERPEQHAIDPDVSYADFEAPGNPLRETWLARQREGSRESS